MHYVGKTVEGEPSLLVDYVKSGRDESFVGATSEPYLITADRKSIEQVAYACGAAHPWRVVQSAPVASHAYLFYLLNNTRTYRVYEQTVITGLPEGRAQLHAGDDFYYHHAIRPGDTLAITATILPTSTKRGRHGDMTFYGDEWRMYNQYNVLAAQLIRRAVALDFGEDGTLTSPREERVDVPATSADPAWRSGGGVRDAFTPGEVLHLVEHPPLSWMSMMAWLSAVDEYSPTHYDPDFAAAHRYGDGKNIVAGPQLASMMVSDLEGALGDRWWIHSYENVQRRAVYPHERLTTFSRVIAVDGETATVHLWLTDRTGVVKGTGTATISPDERTLAS